MKKIIYIFVALLAFAVGMLVYFVQPLFVTVPIDELGNNITFYNSQKIKVRGNLSVDNWDSEYVFYLNNRKEQCNKTSIWNCNFSVELDLPEEIQKIHFPLIQEIVEKNRQLRAELYEKDKNGTLEQKDYDEHVLYRAEVEIVGYVQVERFPSKFSHSNGFVDVSKLRVEEMKIIPPITLVKVY